MAKISVDKKIDALSKKFDEYVKGAKKFEKDTEKKICEHPVQSMAYAFGAGLAAGALITALMRGRK